MFGYLTISGASRVDILNDVDAAKLLTAGRQTLIAFELLDYDGRLVVVEDMVIRAGGNGHLLRAKRYREILLLECLTSSFLAIAACLRRCKDLNSTLERSIWLKTAKRAFNPFRAAGRERCRSRIATTSPMRTCE